MTNSLYFILPLIGVALTMMLWIGRSPARRLSRRLSTRQDGPLPAHWVALIATGLRVPQALITKASLDESIMDLYLMMYPEHCMYDEMELRAILSAIKKHHAITLHETDLAMPLAKLIATCHATQSTPKPMENPHENSHPDAPRRIDHRCKDRTTDR